MSQNNNLRDILLVQLMKAGAYVLFLVTTKHQIHVLPHLENSLANRCKVLQTEFILNVETTYR